MASVMKWIVAGDLAYYPWIYEFDNYEEAKAHFEQQGTLYQTVWLAEVKERKEESRPNT